MYILLITEHNGDISLENSFIVSLIRNFQVPGVIYNTEIRNFYLPGDIYGTLN
jgi:hypothetical protein